VLSENWDDEYEKLEKLCVNNAMEFHVRKDAYPVRFTIGPRLIETGQMSLVDEAPQNEVRMEFVFGEELSVSFVGDFVIDDDLLNKIKSQVKKLHYIWLQIWFRDKNARWERLRKIIAEDENGWNLMYVSRHYAP